MVCSRSVMLYVTATIPCRKVINGDKESVTATLWDKKRRGYKKSSTKLCGESILVSGYFESTDIENNVVYVNFTYSDSRANFTKQIHKDCDSYGVTRNGYYCTFTKPAAKLFNQLCFKLKMFCMDLYS